MASSFNVNDLKNGEAVEVEVQLGCFRISREGDELIFLSSAETASKYHGKRILFVCSGFQLDTIVTGIYVNIVFKNEPGINRPSSATWLVKGIRPLTDILTSEQSEED